MYAVSKLDRYEAISNIELSSVATYVLGHVDQRETDH